MKELEESGFKKLKKKELVSLFQKERYFSVIFGINRIDLEICPGSRFDIKHCFMVGISRFTKVAKPFHSTDPDDDDLWHREWIKPLSPIDIEKAIGVFQRLYKNTKAGKKTIIKDLTEQEINQIVDFCNAPVDIKEQGSEAYTAGKNMVKDNPYPSESKDHWEWRKGYLQAFQLENPPMW